MNMSWLARGAATAERMRRQMQLRGVTPNGHPLWNGQEVGDLVGDYPHYSLALIKLTRRTRPAAHSKASRLGITRRKARDWDENEVPRLRKLYPTGTRAEIEAAFPDRTYLAISRAANSRKIYRAKGPALLTGSHLLDQVLARAIKERYSLKDLDRFARSANYFRRRRWKAKLNEAYHCYAARAMGGVVRARFE